MLRGKINVLVASAVPEELLPRIKAVAPEIQAFYGAPLIAAEFPPALRPGQKAPPLPSGGLPLEEMLREAEVMLAPRRLPPNFLPRVPKLKWIQAVSAGVDYLEGTGIFEGPIILTSASGVQVIPVGEYVLTAMLTLAKDVARIIRDKEQRAWDRFNLIELRSKTLGIVGLGQIGREVGRLGKALEMKVIATRRSWEGPLLPYADELLPPTRLPELLSQSDFVVLCVPLTSDTLKMVGERELRIMKPTAFLINVARGSVVDEGALVRALKEGWIAGAALDVFEKEPIPVESELWDMPNVFLSAHIAGLSDMYDVRVVELFCENLKRYLAGQELLNVVDRSRGY